MRIVGLARAVGGINCDAEIGLDHILTTRPAKRNGFHGGPESGPPRPA
jgi:hypothetical protein